MPHPQEAHQARFCAVKYANGLFPFSNIPSKYICLVAVADEKLEIREEAKRGLTFPSAHTLKELSTTSKDATLPDFPSLLQMIGTKSRMQQNQSEEVHARPTFGKSFVIGFPLEVFIHMLQFFRRLLITSADPDVIIEESPNEYEIQEFVFTPSTRTRVKKWLQDMWELDSRIDTDPKTLPLYISFLETALNHQGPQGMCHRQGCCAQIESVYARLTLTNLIRRQEPSFDGTNMSAGTVLSGARWSLPTICPSSWLVQGIISLNMTIIL